MYFLFYFTTFLSHFSVTELFHTICFFDSPDSSDWLEKFLSVPNCKDLTLETVFSENVVSGLCYAKFIKCHARFFKLSYIRNQ